MGLTAVMLPAPVNVKLGRLGGGLGRGVDVAPSSLGINPSKTTEKAFANVAGVPLAVTSEFEKVSRLTMK